MTDINIHTNTITDTNIDTDTDTQNISISVDSDAITEHTLHSNSNSIYTIDFDNYDNTSSEQSKQSNLIYLAKNTDTDKNTDIDKNTDTDNIIISIKAQLLEEFKTQIINNLDKPLLMKLLIRTMEIVECTQYKGTSQKELVIDILIQFLQSSDIHSTNTEQLITFLKHDASNIIDIIVDASKGNININKVESSVTRFCTLFFDCFKKKQ